MTRIVAARSDAERVERGFEKGGDRQPGLRSSRGRAGGALGAADPEHARVGGRTAQGVCRAALQHWLDADDEPSCAALLGQAIRQVCSRLRRRGPRKPAWVRQDPHRGGSVALQQAFQGFKLNANVATNPALERRVENAWERLPLELAGLREERSGGARRESVLDAEHRCFVLWRIVSRFGGSDSTCSSTSSTGERSGTGLWSTLQRRGPAASTALTLRHHRGSFDGSATNAHTSSGGRAMSTDSSTRIATQ